MNQANVVVEQLVTSKRQQETQLHDKLERNKNTARACGPGERSGDEAAPAQSNSAGGRHREDHLTAIARGRSG